jgi:hypothetical protein
MASKDIDPFAILGFLVTSMKKDRSKTDLFQPVVPVHKAHKDFVKLMESADHTAAKQMMNDVYGRLGDPNGNFIRNFQGEAFHSRLFELACGAYLEAAGHHLDRTHETPDFIAISKDQRVAIEVTTTNPPTRNSTDISAQNIEKLPMAAIMDKCQNEFAIRMGNILVTKRRKRYWSLPQCRGLPVVIIVGPFHEAGAAFYADESLARYLYGVDVFPDWVERNGLLVRAAPVMNHEYAGHSVASNFFEQRQSENISAVIYANAFTESRFFRLTLGKDAENWFQVRRGGFALVPRTPSDYALADFDYDITDPQAPEETWWQGVTVFFNPHARVPLPEDFLPHTSCFRVLGGLPIREVWDFHPLTSWMIVCRKSSSGAHLPGL